MKTVELRKALFIADDKGYSILISVDVEAHTIVVYNPKKRKERTFYIENLIMEHLSMFEN